ncbi:hypothetical protein F4777DRAFT_87752 [Nemania sp. FL0916]|nr:hypothetical protein F4777DRAFT_87752 [Nemania sp. FL0916]
MSHTVMDDSRSLVLAAALEAGQRSSKNVSQKSGSSLQKATVIPAWLQEMPTHIKDILLAEDTVDEDLTTSLLRAVVRRFSNLNLTPADQINRQKSFVDYGVDSMIVSEFRSSNGTVTTPGETPPCASGRTLSDAVPYNVSTPTRWTSRIRMRSCAAAICSLDK